MLWADAHRGGGLYRTWGAEPNLALVERLKTTLEGKLDAYDVILEKTKYLAGDVSSINL